MNVGEYELSRTEKTYNLNLILFQNHVTYYKTKNASIITSKLKNLIPILTLDSEEMYVLP
jgi:hypothetical protein